MAKFTLTLAVNVKKDGNDFYDEQQTSTGLDEQQFIEMEQDLWDLKKKWAAASGLKA